MNTLDKFLNNIEYLRIKEFILSPDEELRHLVKAIFINIIDQDPSLIVYIVNLLDTSHFKISYIFRYDTDEKIILYRILLYSSVYVDPGAYDSLWERSNLRNYWMKLFEIKNDKRRKK